MSDDFYQAVAADFAERMRCEFQIARQVYLASIRDNPVRPYGGSDINVMGFLKLHAMKDRFGGDREVLVYAVRNSDLAAKTLNDGLERANIKPASYIIYPYSAGGLGGPGVLAIVILENEPKRRMEIESIISGMARQPPDYRAKAKFTADL